MIYNDEQIEIIYNLISRINNEIVLNVRKEIDLHSHYSYKINDYIRSVEELHLYQQLGLKELHITRPSLVADIDVDYVANGETNLERMLSGNPPICPITKEIYHIHHIGQKYNSPFAELTRRTHSSSNYYSILHDCQLDSWRIREYATVDFAKEKKEYWKKRGELLLKNESS